jgi:hypothetical protein
MTTKLTDAGGIDAKLPERPLDVTKQFKTPKEMFAAYRLPVVEVLGVNAEPPRSFKYQDTIFPRVELVAKRYYEDQGYLATWSEGIAFRFMREAVSLYICAGLASSYRYNRNIETNPRSSRNHTWSLPEDLHLEATDVMLFRPFLEGHVYFDLAGIALPPAPPSRLDYFESIIEPSPLFDLLISKAELAERYASLVAALKNQAGGLLNPFVSMAQQQYVAKGFDKYGSSPYFKEFANAVFESGGYSTACNELEVFMVPGYNFDLMVFDPKIKQLRFVEVKNRDKLTHGQTMSLVEYLKDPVLPLELCLVQPT